VSRAPQQGDQVQLTIDRGLQTAGQTALAQGAADAATFGNVAAGGAFVALDPRNGQVLAMGSAPTYDPSVFVKGMTFGQYQRLFGPDSGSPQLNRAISSVYPTGSTFKPITALAALSTGKVTPNELIDDSGCIRISNQDFCDAGSKVGQENAIGGVDLVSALRVSSDVYFYRLGQRLNTLPHQPLQRTARMLGLNKLTGIDLPGEAQGTVPDRAWRAEMRRKEIEYEKASHKPCCLFSDKRPWSIGDEVQLAVGQGDLQASPLQMAVAYSALANSGYVVHPHVLRAIQNSNGVFERQGTAQPPTKIPMNLTYRNLIMEGLHEAASMAGGTSAGVFAGWNQNRFPIYGKTGTAQRISGGVENDQSWYVAYSYDSTGKHKRPIVIAMTIEKGGFGAQAAAPAVCRMLNHWFGQTAPCAPQDSRTR
jgi:penicillin-binding protein 2